ncbi:MAG: ABC transporter substrate-binding protein [Solirubrobacterales bacterium]|nr:ABC transporter substrate-binding protein [Solirubrobacterales bacterium]
MRRAAIVTAIAALLLAGCGEKQEAVTGSASSAQQLTLMLDWFPNADHAGIYQALAEGDFSRAGLDVHVQVPSDPAAPLQLLAAGKVDVAISYEPEVLLARDQGLALVSVAALVQKPLTSIISLASKHITSPGALKGKRIGDAGISYQHAYLTTILNQAGVPLSSVKEINVGANLVPAMLSGRVDATLGAFWNYEAIQLTMLRKHPNVIHMEQVGVPTYNELVVVVRKNTIINHPDVVRRFVQALGRGYEAVRRDPQAAVTNLVHASSGLDPKLQLASIRATLPVFFPSNPANPWGWQDPNQWSAYGAWMMKHQLIANPNAVIDASTNELLAGQGL